MIYITGDIHGDIPQRFNPAMMPGEDTWTENDKLIVLGDFGLIAAPRGPGHEKGAGAGAGKYGLSGRKALRNFVYRRQPRKF